MKIWVVTSEEPIPALAGNGRLMRGGMLADCFSDDKRNDVTLWCSTFLHYEKKFYDTKPVFVDLKENLHLKMLHTGKGYKKNVSFDRIRYCRLLARELRKAFPHAAKPDIICCSWPNIEPAYECVRYGKENNIPVMIDIRDFWPDCMTRSFSGILRYPVHIAVNMLYGKKTKYVMKNADKVIGIIPKAIDFAGQHGRTVGPGDHHVFLSFRRNSVSEADLNEACGFWKSLGITGDEFIIAYFGSLTDTCQSSLIIEAAKKNKSDNVKFVLCGNGPNLQKCREETKGCGNIVFPGYMSLPRMAALGEMAGLALLPYRNTVSFVDSVPSKFSEYLSYGLPILTTLKGLSKTLIESENCGSCFSTADELNEVIQKYVNNEAYRNLQSNNALNLFEKSFNADKVYGVLLEELKAEMYKGTKI